MPPLHPDDILKSILTKGCRKDKAEKLQKLHEICFSEYSRHSQGARDLSVAHIARIAESHNILKQKTLWNSQSADYVSLIRAWAEYSGPRQSLASKRLTVPEDKYAILERITDSAVRGFCRIALAERDKLRNELNMLKATNVWAVDMRPKRAITSGEETKADFALTESEARALRLAVDPKILSARNWQETNSGGIVDERGKPIFEPGFSLGIRRVLSGIPQTAIETKATQKPRK